MSLALVSRPDVAPIMVRVSDLAMAIAYHNRITNVFNSHLSLCRVFLGLVEVISNYETKSVTAYGEDEDRKIREERVSSSEIVHLINSDIAPFGLRWMADLLSEEREGQIEKLVEMAKDQFGDQGISEDDLRSVAEKLLDSFMASSDEGLGSR